MSELILNGDQALPKISVHLYMDEIKCVKDRYGNQWTYLGVLGVPDNRFEEALNLITLDTKQMHFDEVKGKSAHSPKVELAKKWLDAALDKKSPFAFRIIGLSHERLNFNLFGEEKQHLNAQHRFIRTVVKQLLNGCWAKEDYSRVVVSKFFHDSTNRPRHWDTSSIRKIEMASPRISFLTREIQFIPSNHQHEKGHYLHSRFLQLTDAVMGLFRYVMDGPSFKNCKGAEYLADQLFPMVSKIIKRTYTHRYPYGVSFFPKNILNEIELQRMTHLSSSCYNDQRIYWQPKKGLQQAELSLT